MGRSIEKRKASWNSRRARERGLLGISPCSAKTKLDRMLLHHFVVSVAGKKCFRCNGNMALNEFSVDHKNPWRSSEFPHQTFFDIGNIEFSHTRCNAIHTSRVKLDFDGDTSDSGRLRHIDPAAWRARKSEAGKRARLKGYVRPSRTKTYQYLASVV